MKENMLSNLLAIQILNQYLAVVSAFNAVYPSRSDYNEVTNMIQNITDEEQRQILEVQLMYCPFVPLCNNLTRTETYSNSSLMSCCEKCSCDGNGDIIGELCPNFELVPRKIIRTCIRPQFLMYGQSPFDSNFSYYMIAGCSADFTDNEIILKCRKEQIKTDALSMFLYVPVTTITTNETYQNIYCALCNHEDQTNLLPWRAKLSCEDGNPFQTIPNTEKELLQMVQQYKTCNIIFEETAIPADMCDWGKYTSCNQTGNWRHYDRIIEQGCNSYTSVYQYMTQYRNIFCFMCNEHVPPVISCQEGGIGIPGFSGSFTALIRYRKPSHKQYNRTCPEQQFYDNYENVCRPVFCPPYSSFENNSCASMFDLVSNKVYEVYYTATTFLQVRCLTQICTEQLSVDVKTAIKELLLSKLNYSTYRDTADQTFISFKIPSNKYTLIYKMAFEVRVPHDPEIYLETLTSIHEIQAIHNNNSIKTTIKVLSKFAFETEQSLASQLEFPQSSLEEVSMDVVQVISTYYCPRLKFKDEDVIISASKVVILNINVIYNLTDSIRDGNSVMVCLGPYEQATNRTIDEKRTDNFTEEILSLICSTLSIICLVLTIAVYSVFKELRSVPGINNMILSGHLILAHLLYLVGFHATANYKLCTTIGMLTHYFWLSSIMWMHVCSLHMFRVFAFMIKLPHISQSQRAIPIYVIYAITVSVILVISNIIYSVSDAGNKIGYLGYGGEICYISNPRMILITFVIPVGIILFSNIVLFCIVVCRLEKLPDFKTTNRQSRHTFNIYIRLSCLTGVTWIFGFINQWTLFQAFSYIFIVLNASQGLFIFVSFCCTARVRHMWRSKWQQRQDITKPTTGTTNMSTLTRTDNL